jgi:predicted nuclease of predicted toxin-antitoxin system
MARYVVDEDLPRSLARRLRACGFDAVDVRDEGLRGCADEEVFDFAVRESRAVVTADVGFGNILRFPLGLHAGIILARFPNQVPVSELNSALTRVLSLLKDHELKGNVVTVTPTRIRIRRPPQE